MKCNNLKNKIAICCIVFMNLILFIQCDVKNNLQNFSNNNEIREIDSLINKAKLGYENVGDENIINTYEQQYFLLLFVLWVI